MNEQLEFLTKIAGLEPNQYTNTGMSPSIEKIAELEPNQYANTGMSPIQYI